MTIEERAKRYAAAFNSMHMNEQITLFIERALREQDAATRDACAEAIYECKDYLAVKVGAIRSIKVSDAHAACLNAKVAATKLQAE